MNQIPIKNPPVTFPKCTLCLERAGVIQVDFRLRLFTCLACDHTFTIKSKDELEVYEEKYYLEKHTHWFANPNYSYFERVYRLMMKLKKDVRSLLDVGYGNGDFLKYLAKKKGAFRLYGIDSLKIDFPGIQFIQGDFFTYAFKRSFDVITSFMVIEHIEDPRLFVKKLYEYLEPGGFLFISTNNNGGMLYGVARFLKRFGVRVVYDRVYSDHHLQHFTNESLRRILQKNGFEVREFRNHNYPLKAVDTPPANFLVKKFYLAVVWIIFRLSDLFGNGFLQTFVCVKPLA